MANRKKVEAAGSAVFDKFFSSQDAQNGSQDASEDSVSISSQSVKSGSEKDQKKQKKVFSFRGDQTAVTSWRLYADASGLKVDDLGTAAMMEYIENHPLTKDQQKIFDLKMKQKG